MSEEQYEPGILDIPDEQTDMIESSEPLSGYIATEVLKELKHSIRLHLLIMDGPTQQLCAMLLKCPDLLGDNDPVRRDNEASELAFTIVEGIALYILRSIDERYMRSKSNGQPLPDFVKEAGDKVMVKVGQYRGDPDKLKAKKQVLRSVADALRALGSHTKVIYPDIYDSDGNQL
jgi:hypothetical protein